MYYHNILYIRRILSLPDAFRKITGKYIELLLGSRKPKYGLIGATLSIQRQMRLDEIERAMIQNQIQARHRQIGRNFPAFFDTLGLQNPRQNNVNRPQVVLNEESITQLMDMGFGREEAINALTMSRNDVGGAAAMLLR